MDDKLTFFSDMEVIYKDSDSPKKLNFYSDHCCIKSTSNILIYFII